MKIENAKILIVDDDVLIAETLSDHLMRLGCKQIRMKHSATDAKKLLAEWLPDLAMLDIRMEHGRSGLELGQLLATTFHIPFMYITAHADETITQLILETKPKGYITKPIRENELLINLGMVLNDVIDKEDEKIYFQDGNETISINKNNIYYLKANGNYWEVITKAGSQLLRTTLDDLILNLPATDFFRIHRSYIVNRNYISGIKHDQLKICGTTLPVSRTYSKELLKSKSKSV